MKSAALIHKSPAKWNKEKIDLDGLVLDIARLDTNYQRFEKSVIFEQIREFDVYFSIFRDLCELRGIEEIHVVQAYDNSEIRNYQTERKNGFIESHGVKFWSIDNIRDISPFFRCDMLMTRGQYPNFHNQMKAYRGDKKGSWLHYSATARHYPCLEDVANSWKDELKKSYSSTSKKISNFLTTQRGAQWKPAKLYSLQAINETTIDLIIKTVKIQRMQLRCDAYDMVLLDDWKTIHEIESIYPKSLPHVFIKPNFPPASEILRQRMYDIIFCGTTLVSTKNHKSFIGLIRELDKQGKELKICVVGDEGSIPEFTEFTNSYLANIKITNFGVLPRKEVLGLFSNSKTCIVTSGRDCNPRIIAESAIHGCRVIATDILSDGFETLTKYPLIGAVIELPKESIIYDEKNSPSGDLTNSASQFLVEIEKSTHPLSTSRLAIKLFDIKRQSTKINESIELLQ